jgi:SpoVK/Ycf46/Vps4 family AAA+-type ATPase
MLNNNRKNTFNVLKINKYNHFLSSLDNAKINLNMNINANATKNEIQTEKKEIDNIIKNINYSYDTNKYFSDNFTGQIKRDTPDQYIYEDLLQSIANKFNALHLKRNSDKESTIKKKEIKIECEINNISDILNLIETYKLEDHIKYNINMKALHKIKEPLKELNSMIGMNNLKTEIVEQILYFVQDFHTNNVDFMHTVIYGDPGTGKTEIAKILGKIYSKIGLLQKETFKKVTRSDLVAGYLGQTALKTREVINEAIGGVLFIDEAYALGNSDKRDSFSKECIDTLCEALSDHKENLMVIIAGYEKELKECFFNYNQGLDSRFTWRFKTDDYSHEDLYYIFLKKVKEIGWEIDKDITIDWFKKNKECFQFYGRDIETVLAKTKIAHSKRVFCLPDADKKKINIKDLNKGLEIFIKNNDVQRKLNDEYTKKQIYNSLYC